MMSAKAGSVDWWKWCGILLLLFSIGASFRNSLTGEFVFDDEFSIESNPSIRSISTGFWAPRDLPTAGRPVVNFSLALNYAVGGLNVEGYHLVNLIVHLLNGLVVFALVHRSCSAFESYSEPDRSVFSLSIALLWALHPIQTETVSYITQRTELAAALCILVTLYAARRASDAASRHEGLCWSVAAVSFCFLGVGCKEITVVAPVLVLLYDYLILEQTLRKLWMRRKALYIGLFASWLMLAGLLATNPRGRSVGFDLGVGPWSYFTTQCCAIVWYLRLAFWPDRLCGDYGQLLINDFQKWFPCCLLLCALGTITIWGLVKRVKLSYLGFFFFVMLAPTSSFIPIITEPIAERRMYLPLFSFVVLICTAVYRLASWYSRDYRNTIMLVLTGFAACSLGYATYVRNVVFDGQVAFWKDATGKCPTNARAFKSLGSAYVDSGEMDRAKKAFEKSKELEPRDPSAYFNLAVWHSQTGDRGTAIGYFQEALVRRPNDFDSNFNFGNLLMDLGRLEEAVGCFRKATEAYPESTIAHLNLGNALVGMNRMEEADVAYRRVLELDPKYVSALLNLGAMEAKRGRPAEAIRWTEQALKLSPNEVDAFNNLGYCYEQLGQYVKSIEAYERCVAINPNDVGAWLSLGKVYLADGKPDNARVRFRKALEIQPASVEARQELEALQLK